MNNETPSSSGLIDLGAVDFTRVSLNIFCSGKDTDMPNFTQTISAGRFILVKISPLIAELL